MSSDSRAYIRCFQDLTYFLTQHDPVSSMGLDFCLDKQLFVAVFLGCTNTGRDCVYGFFVVLCPGTPKGSTSSGSGFKASQKTRPQLKVSSDRLGEAGNRTFDPWFTRHRFIPYTTAASPF